MKNIWKYFFLFLSTSVTAQNLVPNPSFEDTVACPAGIGQINMSIGWSSYSYTPDYLNACSSGQAGVPSNLFGFQNARTGNAYAGLYTFNSSGFYREIIGIQLSQSLVIGEQYFVSFFVSKAINLNIAVRTGIATNKFGARFSTASFSSTNPVPINNFSQVYSDSVITDSVGWVKISGSFIADSAYNFLSIGNFFTDSATTIQLDSNAVNAYYYVDDICVSTDSLLCAGEVIKEISENNSDIPVNIFPNPFKEKIHFINNSNSAVSVEIYTSMAQLIFKNTINEKEYFLNVVNYPDGVYFVCIKQNKKNYLKKILKN